MNRITGSKTWVMNSQMLMLFVLMLVAHPSDAAGLKADEQVIFIPSIGGQTGGEDGPWTLDIQAWALEPESRALGLFVFRKAMGLESDELTPDELSRFNEQARWFLVDNERNKLISVWLNEKVHSLGRTEANGRLSAQITLPHEDIVKLRTAADAPVISFSTVSARGGGRMYGGQVHLLESTGLSVISDLDDTIKVSEVLDRDKLLRNTFLRPFVPVEGMADAYRAWMIHDGAQFHYVSSSPIQLYVPLSEFVQASSFPAGTFHLKEFRWKDESFFNLFASSVEHKLGVIEPILRRFPQRRFVLVGDSGEKDPEIYGALARDFPAQIFRVLIRDVTGDPRESDRYSNAFREVPDVKWSLFKNAAQLPPTFR